MEIVRLSAKDFDEAMDFINMVFSMAYGPMDFVKLLPRLYKPTDECMSRNLAVRENGRIRALVGMYPDQILAGDTSLKLGGIGAVSSHPGDRGKGWMKVLMERQMNAMQQEGYDLSFLVGLRRRYMYFGYEKTGTMLQYKININNIKHLKLSDDSAPIRFHNIQPTEVMLIKQAKALYDKQLVRCDRPLDEFYRYLLTSHMQPWAALNPEGKMVGYLSANTEHNQITELFVQDEASLYSMIYSWFPQQKVQEATITQPLWAQNAARHLGGMAEDVLVTNSGNWRIFNWVKLVDALLRVKAAQHQLADGALCVGIREYGNLKLIVCGTTASCENTTERADVEWEPFTAMRILFGHIPTALVAGIPKSLEPIISSWFPLPFGWLPQNYV